MTRRRWLPLLVRAVPVLAGVILFVLVIGLIVWSRPTVPPGLEARDPDSPTVVRVRPIPGIGGRAGWDVVISADGRRPTQHAGWPVGLVAPAAEPTAVVWHDDPDWVEIVLTSGQRLKLSWDPAAALHARASSQTTYYLDPKYTLLGDR